MKGVDLRISVGRAVLLSVPLSLAWRIQVTLLQRLASSGDCYSQLTGEVFYVHLQIRNLRNQSLLVVSGGPGTVPNVMKRCVPLFNQMLLRWHC